MTIQTFSQSPPYIIQNTGPYPITHPYGADEIDVFILTADNETLQLPEADFTVTPDEDEAGGNVVISSGAASEHSGRTLYISRNTRIEQGWAAQSGAREEGLEVQLDRLTRALQDVLLRTDRALTLPVTTDVEPPTLQPGTAGAVLRWNQDGTTIENGPNGDDIENAEAYAERAETALNSVLANQGRIDITTFGAVADWARDEGGTITGTNNAAAFDLMVAQMKAQNLPGYIPPGEWRFIGTQLNDSGLPIYGAGQSETRLVAEVYEDDKGYQGTTTGSSIYDIEVTTVALEQKLANSGQSQACIVLGEGFFTTAPQDEITFLAAKNVRCTRLDTSFGSSFGVFVIGNVTGGYIDNVDDFGTAETLTGLVQFHWSGHNILGGYGYASEEVYPILGIGIGRIRATNSLDALILSSTGDISVDQITVDGPNVRRALYVLPGDETNTLTRAGAAERQGKNIRISSISVLECSASGSELIDINGTGTSAWAYYANDPTAKLKTQLVMDVWIGSISVTAAPSSGSKRVCFINQCAGQVAIDKIDAPNWTIGSILDVNRNSAKVTIGSVNGSDQVVIDRSTNVTIGRAAPKLADTTTTNLAAFYCYGERLTSTVDGAHAKGATTLAINTRFTSDVCLGDTLLVNGYPVKATAFFEQTTAPGCYNIDITALPVAIADGATVELDLYSRVDAVLDTIGGYYGGDIVDSYVKIRPGSHIEGAGYRAMRVRDAALVYLDQVDFENSGVNRADNATLTTGDLIVEEDAHCRANQCTFGINGVFTEYNVRLPDSDADDDNRLILTDCVFDQSITDPITFSSVTDYTAKDCTLFSDGSAVT